MRNRMRPYRGLVLGLVAASLVAAACGGGTSANPAPKTKPKANAGIAATVQDFSIGVPSTVKAGAVHFAVHNAGPSMHEFVVIKTTLADGDVPLKGDGTEANEDANGLDGIGEVEDVAAGTTKDLTLTLAPGHYIVICNIPGHYKAGMHASFTVA
jgi:uncharacterized cupredoxin-like copper-binding protein